MEYRQNQQLRLAEEFVQYTNRHIFLTGKAGTGKTTFLHNLKKITPKRIVVVAPTGVAAINAGGVTIHSFFQLNFGINLPESVTGESVRRSKEGYKQKFHREKINLIKCIDLLVIDEVSMVRADVLDAIDDVLRRYRNAQLPFGGVQLLMIGDLHQLSPVVKEAEWDILRDHYPSAYFFDARALKNAPMIILELKENFRQSDQYFIDLLNRVRDSEISPEVINQLNSRHIQGFSPDDKEGYIILSTHNATTAEINQSRLKSLKSHAKIFSASIKDDFPQQDYPTEAELVLKTGAQVMFIKNDPSTEKRFYNGKIGRIVRFEENSVVVQCPGDKEEIETGPLIWENLRYSVDQATKEIKEELAGTFSQIPLRLAWAITIHKSQGLTFDKVIIDANAAFASGQVYVALSRCRTFEGIVLRTPINSHGIKTDYLVRKFADDSRQNEPDSKKLFESRYGFQQELIIEMFNFKDVRYLFDQLIRTMKEHANIFESSLINSQIASQATFEDEVFQVSLRFRNQINSLLAPDVLPEDHPLLQERITKAIAYFSDKLRMLLQEPVSAIRIETDNKAAHQLLNDRMEKLLRELFIRMACMKANAQRFETLAFLKARSGADVDFRFKSASDVTKKQTGNRPHGALYAELKEWRDATAAMADIQAYQVLPNKSLNEITRFLPQTKEALKEIKGIGSVKLRLYAKELLPIIRQYCQEQGISETDATFQEEKNKKKNDSGVVSLEMFKQGKTIREIAGERGLAVSTIEAHLGHYVTSGEIDVNHVVAPEKVKPITDCIGENPGSTLSALREKLGEDFTYAEIRFVLQSLTDR